MDKLIPLLGSLFTATALYFGLPFDGPINTGISIFALIAGLWLTEAIPLSATALLVPVAATLLGVFDVKTALANFAHPVIFIFMGGFAIAAALRQQALDKAMATQLIKWANGSFKATVLLLFGATAALSMWISNMATTAIMLPLALGLLANAKEDTRPQTTLFVLLGIAYCASLGGMGTLVGSAPNAIAGSYAGLDFAYWLQRALPLVVVLVPVVILCTAWLHKPDLNQTVDVELEHIEMTPPRWITLGIFAMVVVAWMFSSPLSEALGGLGKIDALIAILGIVALCATKVASWDAIETETDWGVLLLFGGGLCLSGVLKTTGTASFFAEALSGSLQGAPSILILGAIIAFVITLTEFASNTASAAILVPMFGALAETMGLSVIAVSMMIGVTASCAFMLPVATPPNALVFGTGKIPLKAMMRTGLLLNIICLFIITACATFIW